MLIFHFLALVITVFPSPLLPAPYYKPLLNRLEDRLWDQNDDVTILTNPSSSTLSQLDSNSKIITLSHSAGSQRMILRNFKKLQSQSQSQSPPRPKPNYVGHIFVSYNNYPLSSSMPYGSKIAKFRDYVSLINLPSRSKSVSRNLQKITDENVLIVQAANDGIDQSVQLHEALKEGNDVRFCRLGGGHLDCVNSEDCADVVERFVKFVCGGSEEGRIEINMNEMK
ncbi:hypothetical protein TL16_g00564 [Triparma laevis f. inornata]|uniref:Uncharacterized protein n=2 Tax=Triparma laevis TaxID=1534972 RepID=A0A9W7FLM0_9STRA|nr:hypothetical protein TL16_g00564 [Triparma laevis f. inornata]GMI14246.1 hypothetical protein TrLO_g13072 [Triparma laevis f. longispina]